MNSEYNCTSHDTAIMYMKRQTNSYNIMYNNTKCVPLFKRNKFFCGSTQNPSFFHHNERVKGLLSWVRRCVKQKGFTLRRRTSFCEKLLEEF